MNRIKRIIFIILGLISLLLGIIGTLLPILPTVPFLLLTSYCFARGSKKFDEKVYTYESFEIPAALGQPQMEQEELKNLKIKTPQEINEAIKFDNLSQEENQGIMRFPLFLF